MSVKTEGKAPQTRELGHESASGTLAPAPEAAKAALEEKLAADKAEANAKAEADAKAKRTYKRVDLSGITLDLATANADRFGTDETVGVLIDPETRSDVQRHFDTQVAVSHEEWTAGGKPAAFLVNGAPCAGARRIFLDPSQEAAYRTLLQSAAKQNACGLRILPVQKHTSGKYMLPWVARDAVKRPRKPGDNATGESATGAVENATPETPAS